MPALSYELMYLDRSSVPGWQLYRRYSGTSERQARREFEAWNRDCHGEFALYRVERTRLHPRRRPARKQS